MSNARVLLVSPVGYIGGAEQVQLSLAATLCDAGFNPIVATLRPGVVAARARDMGIESHEFPTNFRYRQIEHVWGCLKWLQEICSTRRASLIHASHTSHLISGLAARRIGIREVWQLHDFPGGFDIVDQVNRRIPSDHIIFTTENVKSGYPMLLSTESTVINPDCIDVAEFDAIRADLEILTRLSVSPKNFFLTTARIQIHKGLEYLIRAIPKVAARLPTCRWVIVGKASEPQQQEYLGELRRLIQSLGIKNKVCFAGFVSDEELAALRSNAIALVHPAISEGYGIVLVEAMLSNLPIIAARAAGPSTLIRQGIDGLLVPIQDAEALAEEMLRVYCDSRFAKSLAKNARVAAEKRDVRIMTVKVAKVYEKVLTSTKN